MLMRPCGTASREISGEGYCTGHVNMALPSKQVLIVFEAGSKIKPFYEPYRGLPAQAGLRIMQLEKQVDPSTTTTRLDIKQNVIEQFSLTISVSSRRLEDHMAASQTSSTGHHSSNLHLRRARRQAEVCALRKLGDR